MPVAPIAACVAAAASDLWRAERARARARALRQCQRRLTRPALQYYRIIRPRAPLWPAPICHARPDCRSVFGKRCCTSRPSAAHGLRNRIKPLGQLVSVPAASRCRGPDSATGGRTERCAPLPHRRCRAAAAPPPRRRHRAATVPRAYCVPREIPNLLAAATLPAPLQRQRTTQPPLRAPDRAFPIALTPALPLRAFLLAIALPSPSAPPSPWPPLSASPTARSCAWAPTR